MKNNSAIIVLFLSTVFAGVSCHRGGPENTGVIDNGKAIVRSASAAGATICDFKASEPGYTVTFYEPFLWDGDNRSYEQVTVSRKELIIATEKPDRVHFQFLDKTVAELFFEKGISLSIERDNAFLDYAGETVTVPFDVLKGGSKKDGDLLFSFEKNELSAEIHYTKETKSGEVVFTVPAEGEKAAALSVSDGHGTVQYSFSAAPYTFELTASEVRVGAEAGATAVITCTVETDIPDYKLEYTIVEGDFFSLDGNTVTATKDNDTNAVREGTIRIEEASGYFEPVIISVSQEILPDEPNITTPEGCVVFTDKKMKNAMVAIADTDGDGEISFDEALQVKEINVVDKGIQNLTGIEAFQNVEKLDARDNDIVDARIISSLPRLYWLDLTGNANLEELDITGCSLFFEHCDFEKTESLNLTILREQVGPEAIEGYKDKVHNIWDNRESVDYSHHRNLKLVHVHTKGKGTYPVVISGLGWLDVEVNNGTFDRMMNDFVNRFRAHPDIVDFWDYLDVYVYIYISDSRKEYEARYKNELDEDRKEKKKHYLESQNIILDECYGAIYGESPTLLEETNKRMLILTLDVLPHPTQGFAFLYADVSWYQGSSRPIRLKNAMDAPYRLTRIVCEEMGATHQYTPNNYTYLDFFNKDYNPYDHVMQFFGLPE